MVLQCTSCHNPHGNDNYRMLRSTPEHIEGDPVKVPDEDEESKIYTTSYDKYGYPDFSLYRADIRDALDDWCSYCHKAYLAGPNSGHQASDDAMFEFRHMSDDLGGSGCILCHVAHGTSASMGPYSSRVPWPSSSGSHEGDASRSSLLWADSRAVCGMCHTNESLRSD